MSTYKKKFKPVSEDELFVLTRQWLEDKIEEGAKAEEQFVKGTPHPKQRLFLEAEADPVIKDQKIIEVLFGGSVGGGKTWTLLAAALQYVHVPGYSALLLRKSFPDLAQEGGLMNLSKEWLTGTSAKWSERDRTWSFPSGATLRFGYLETDNDRFRYLGGEYQFIGWDELTQHHETVYKFLFSRVRKRASIPVPLRVMGATNPGNVGGKWVFERFIPNDFTPARARERDVWYKEHPPVLEGTQPHITAFIPSMLDDNPSLDREAYLESLMQLDEITRQQYLSGDWQIQTRGDILYTYSEAHTVISWSQFEKVFGRRSIPTHWRTGVYLDAGTTEGHPNVTSWFATAANNAPVVNGISMSGKVFLYRGHTTTQTSAREMSHIINTYMRQEKGQCVNWQMSHEASSERLEFNKQGLPFVPWKTGRTRGIEQLKNAFSVVDTDKVHPFKPELRGCPQMFLVVDDEELIRAESDKGLARWREEILAYHWNQPKSGEPPTRLVPYPLFNDACLVAGTLVETDRGSVPIECVTNQDLVLTREGYRRCSGSYVTNKHSTVYKYEFSDHSTITGTKNHPIFVDGNFAELDSLRIDNSYNIIQVCKKLANPGTGTDVSALIMSTGCVRSAAKTSEHESTANQSVVRIRVVSVTELPAQPVYNLTVFGKPEYFANNILVHNCDTMRAAAADYFPLATRKTIEEKVRDAVEAVQPSSYLESIQDPLYRAHVLTQRAVLADLARKELEETTIAAADWLGIG